MSAIQSMQTLQIVIIAVVLVIAAMIIGIIIYRHKKEESLSLAIKRFLEE